MDTRYILPATIAASLHVIALFGFNSHTDRTKPPADVKPPPEVVICEIPDPVDPPEPDDTPAAEPKGDPDAARPESPEPPERLTADVTMPRPPESPRRLEVTDIIKPGVPGILEGREGPRTNGPLVNFESLDNAPRARARVAPSYPGELRTAGITGEVLVAFVVDESGHVAKAWVVRSTDSRFETATLRAVERWRFEPGKKNGRTVRFRMEVPIMFSLSE